MSKADFGHMNVDAQSTQAQEKLHRIRITDYTTHAEFIDAFRRVISRLRSFNQAVIAATHDLPVRCSQKPLQESQALIRGWSTRARCNLLEGSTPGKAATVWVPGHANIPGNERADQLAGKAADCPLADHASEMSLAGPAAGYTSNTTKTSKNTGRRS